MQPQWVTTSPSSWSGPARAAARNAPPRPPPAPSLSVPAPHRPHHRNQPLVPPPGLIASATGDVIDEGGTASVTFTFTDTESAGPHSAVIDWADGDIDTLPSVTSPFTATHPYLDDGLFIVAVTVILTGCNCEKTNPSFPLTLGETRAYLAVYGAATATDVAHFFGARVSNAKLWLAALDGELTAVRCGDRQGLLALAPDIPALTVKPPAAAK